MAENKIKISSAKGRPMLNWVGKKPLDYVKGFPAQLVEVFDPPGDLSLRAKGEAISYENLKDNWHNLLFHGDNKDILATLLELGFRGKIDLIYIDPPFKSGADYVRKVELRGLKNLGRIEEDEASILQQTMYFDIWNNDTYLQFMYERLILLKELLADTGSIYVHLDWRMAHYVKLLIDEIFGEDNFLNEVIVHYTAVGLKAKSKKFHQNTENILWYAKHKGSHIYNEVYEKLDKPRKASMHQWNEKMGKAERIRDKDGKIRYFLVYEEKADNFIEVPAIRGDSKTGFQTQKHDMIFKRIIKAASNENGIVLDCFIGSGTTLAVAQALGRRWIGCDINKGAIQITSKRLQGIIQEQIKNAIALAMPRNDSGRTSTNQKKGIS
ncbi:site-specific DNA-methyltransferase [candidate division WOR-3 bacterium]|nr:site-specific DNA-methyltransferase [candidate division WOR-3 bacterium]MCK4328717.1 site-specific DNA-methyltransferase [candidate division WOR-3 bacterium]